MRSAVVHGVLLLVMLVFGYRTWTRDKTVRPNVGEVVLWNGSEADLASVTLTNEKRIVKVERRGDGAGAYWWGSETTIDKKPVAADKQPAAGSGSAAEPKTEEVRKTTEFPLGEGGTKLVTNYAAGRAVRDLGIPTDASKKDYKLVDAKTTIAVTFKNGQTRTFLVGGTVYGDTSRYVVDQATGKAYVFAKEFVSPIESGKSALQLSDPRGFDDAKLDKVVIAGMGENAGKSKTVVHVMNSVEGSKVKTWGDDATKKPDAALANFIENTKNLRPTDYLPDLKVSTLTPIMTMTFKDEGGAQLGTMALYRGEKPGELPEGQELDPANPPKGETVYYIVTEKTRVPAIVRNDTAQRAEQDLPVVFGDKPAPTTPTPPAPDMSSPGALPGLPQSPPPGTSPGTSSPAGTSPPGASPHAGMSPLPGASPETSPHPGLPGTSPGSAGSATPAPGSASPAPGSASPAPGSAASPKAPAPTGASPAAAHP